MVLGLHQPFDIMLLSTLPFRFEVRCCVSYVLSVALSSDGKPSRASLGALFLRVFTLPKVAAIISSGTHLGQLGDRARGTYRAYDLSTLITLVV